MAEKDEEKQGFKVVDRRRFDDEGKDRSENSSTSEAQGFTMKESSLPSSKGEETEITFSSFIVSLATQAMMHMGTVGAPKDMSVPVDRGMAKHTIDILSMIRDKTKGNLESVEERMFDEILHELRSLYVKSAK